MSPLHQLPRLLQFRPIVCTRPFHPNCGAAVCKYTHEHIQQCMHYVIVRAHRCVYVLCDKVVGLVSQQGLQGVLRFKARQLGSVVVWGKIGQGHSTGQ
jgi:hypothetical protein